MNRLWIPVAGLAAMMALCLAAGDAPARRGNLVRNADFSRRSDDGHAPADYQLAGAVEYRYLGDPARDVSGWGVAFQSAGGAGAGSVAQRVTGIDARSGRWFRFSFRGLPQNQFAVEGDDLYMKVEFFADAGKTPMDGKVRKIYPLVEQARRDLAVNGDGRAGGAAVWRTYSLDFWLPFPQVDQLRLTVGFGHGAARAAKGSEFFVGDFSLAPIDGPDAGPTTKPQGPEQRPENLLPLGGRWFYRPRPGETRPPAAFDETNADRLIYHDDTWATPFAGNMTAWLRAGDMDVQGNIVQQDRLISDNVTVAFDATSMIIHTRGIPNHPTGKFPESTSSPWSNPNYIQEQNATYYIPLDPQENPRHVATATDNSNHALPMGPIAIAVNGVVFFNPFDAQSTDASNIMDRCCGHPNQDGLYHYHKYPICINSPWADEGQGHSPLIGFAFDGFPIYGPYEKAGVMAKDVTGDGQLNEFNMHWDAQRGWHYHVTPGKFPYIIGGYWGTEDPRDRQRPGGRRGSGPGGGGPGGGNGPPGMGGRPGPPGGFGNGRPWPPPGPPPGD